MRPLKAPLLWLTIGWLLVAAACFGSLIPGHRLPLPGGSDKLLHAGTYLILMIWFAGIYQSSRYFVIAIALLGLGVALEFGQRLVITRAFDGLDLTANLVGVLLGWALAATLLGGWCQLVEGWLFETAGGSS